MCCQYLHQYHALTKYISQARADATLSTAARAAKIAALEQQRQALGGIDAYQRASLAGESTAAYAAFNASKWVLAYPAVAAALKRVSSQSAPVASGASDASGSAHAGKKGHSASAAGARNSGVRLLDVGALCNHYRDIPHLHPTAIDLRPQVCAVIILT